uniref:GATA-type domain-containing protein n=1 Tax=Macrostomum lignano TaxID=282301 RepID=A0A1I8HEJ1_9PLAT
MSHLRQRPVAAMNGGLNGIGGVGTPRCNWRRSADVSQWELATLDTSQWRRSVDASQWVNGVDDAPNQRCDACELAGQSEAEPPWRRRATRGRQLNSVTRRVATAIASRDCPRQDVRRMFSFQQPEQPETRLLLNDCDENSNGVDSNNGSDGTVDSMHNSASSSRCCSSCVFEDSNNNGHTNGNGINASAPKSADWTVGGQCNDVKSPDNNDDGMGAYPT